MSTTYSRYFSALADYNAGNPIDDRDLDGEFDAMTIALNRKVLCAGSAPSAPIAGQTWVDTTNKYLKWYRNNEWIIITAVHVGSSAMATPQEGDAWYDTTNDILQYYNGAAWVSVFGWSKGSDVASASTITLVAASNFFVVTGTTTITSITAGSAGRIVCLEFSGALTLTNGSNLKLNGDLVTASLTTVTLVSDGTNWYELSRSPVARIATAVSKSAATAYLAATDGFLVIQAALTTSSDGFTLYTDGSNPPTTILSRYVNPPANSGNIGGMIPIKKGNYYKGTVDASATLTSLYFIPLGS